MKTSTFIRTNNFMERLTSLRFITGSDWNDKKKELLRNAGGPDSNVMECVKTPTKTKVTPPEYSWHTCHGWRIFKLHCQWFNPIKGSFSYCSTILQPFSYYILSVQFRKVYYGRSLCAKFNSYFQVRLAKQMWSSLLLSNSLC